MLVVEWGVAGEQIFGDDSLLITFEVADDESRRLTLHPRGSWADRPLGEVVS